MTELAFFGWIGIAAAALLLAFGLWALARKFPFPTPDSYKGIFLVFLGLLPLLVVALATGVTYESSKSVNFCASCHVMDPWVHNLKDPKSDSLAAMHYKNRYIQENQCFTCHTDYSLFGDMKAKMNGLRHVKALVLNQVPEKIELFKPYNTANCLHCHGESKKFNESETHVGILDSIKGGETSCLDCHNPAHETGKKP